MAGYKNENLRSIVRHYFSVGKHHGHSDRRVSLETGVHRQIVVEVRRQMITEGHLPQKDYKEFASVRGGYVRDESGRVVREADAMVTAAGKLSRRAERTLAELLKYIRSRPLPAPAAGPKKKRFRR